jgi:KipI family sensor histidine kinase inhibitor
VSASGGPRLLPAGEAAVLVDFGGAITPAVNDRVRRLHSHLAADPPSGFRGAVPAFTSILVRFDPLTADPDAFLEALTRLTRMAGDPIPPGRELEVPAAYGGEFGPDLAYVAARAGLTEEQAIAIHAGRTYRVYMLGFLVGFPYLAPVSSRIAAPRRADPRLRVPAGSIGIAGRQTGIYPIAAPGGWQLVARTPVRLWDPSRHPPAALRPGDRIRFRRIPAAEFAARERDLPWPEAVGPTPPAPEPGRDLLRVVAAGPLTTVQDGGRAGYEEFGVPAGGALDEVSYRVANRLAGNDPAAAVLEVTGGGLMIEAMEPVRIALAGADLAARVNAEPFPPGTQRMLHAGDRLALERPRSGLRAYLAVEGGVAVPTVLGSRSTCLAAGFGGLDGRALRAGDVIAAYPGRGLPPPEQEIPPRLRAFAGSEVTLRVTPGPQSNWLSSEAWAAFLGQDYTIGPASDRMGLRLEGCRPVASDLTELVSEGVPPGAVQLLPSGQPVLLLADRQTTGGYPKPAVVAAVDLPAAAQLLPGARVRFLLIGVASARRLLEERDRLLASWAGKVRNFRLLVNGTPHLVTVEEYDR